MEAGDRARKESELVVYLLDTTREPGDEEKEIAQFLANDTSRMLVVLNKTDAKASRVARTKLFVKEHFPMLNDSRIITASALKKEHIEDLSKYF